LSIVVRIIVGCIRKCGYLIFFEENKVQIRKLCAIVVANYMQAWENKQLIALS